MGIALIQSPGQHVMKEMNSQPFFFLEQFTFWTGSVFLLKSVVHLLVYDANNI
jgi:hypothetical protein